MPLNTVDRLEILELLSAYAHAVDSGDGKAYADCFTKDGIIELQSTGLHVQGRDALAKFAREDHARSGAARHLTNSPIIEGGSNHATIDVYLLRLFQDRSGDNQRGLGVVGRYHDTLQRIDGYWCFARREVFIDPQ
jgi:hypothetical protein